MEPALLSASTTWIALTLPMPTFLVSARMSASRERHYTYAQSCFTAVSFHQRGIFAARAYSFRAQGYGVGNALWGFVLSSGRFPPRFLFPGCMMAWEILTRLPVLSAIISKFMPSVCWPVFSKLPAFRGHSELPQPGAGAKAHTRPR